MQICVWIYDKEVECNFSKLKFPFLKSNISPIPEDGDFISKLARHVS